MGITEILKRILFSANKIKRSEYFSKQSTQLIIAAHNCHIEDIGKKLSILYGMYASTIYYKINLKKP